jgi:2-C-methyl-D-erythritol 2,4-cyclodiphosphate synthase
MIKTGIGQDSHRFSDKGPLVLGTVVNENFPALQANSDGDVILHALCNALTSAVGKGSLSTFADIMCRDQGITDSKEYLKKAAGFVHEMGYKINNVAVSVEAKKPKLETYFPEMRKGIAMVLQIEADDVGLTATSGEGLSSCGRGEGIQATAVVCIQKR